MSKFAKVVKTVQDLYIILSSTESIYLEDLMRDFSLSENSAVRFLYHIYNGSTEQLARLYTRTGQELRIAELKQRLTQRAVTRDEKVVKALRLVQLLDLLNEATPSGGLTLKQLQSRCRVSERTLYRDLNCLETEMGVALIRPNPGQAQKGCYKLEGTYLNKLSPEQAVLIYLSTLQQQGSILAGHIENIKGHLFNGLIANRFEASKIESLQGKVHFVSDKLSNSQEVAGLFGQIVSALLEQRPLKIQYYTASKGCFSDRVVHPYGLICKQSTWYLIAYCCRSKGLRTFRVDSIKRGVTLQLERFHVPESFSVQDYVGNAWGVVNEHKSVRVVLKFDKSVAHRVKGSIYHTSQRILQEEEDGALLVEFHLSGLLELQLWLLHWTDNVKIIEPDYLRGDMQKLLKKMLENYQN